jgi:7,8-dihydroneopterin aldolase/epimerase/oxygenase
MDEATSTTTGTVGFRDLEVPCIIGIHPHERTTEQRLVVDLEMEYDFSPALVSGSVKDVLHYGEIAAFVTEVLRERRYKLLERAATDLVQEVQLRYPGITHLALEIRKPQAMEGTAVPYVRLCW